MEVPILVEMRGNDRLSVPGPAEGPRRYNPPVPKGEYLQYGGQAIIEGVMMRSPRYFSVAARAPNGEIVVHTEAIEKTWIGRQKWLKLPFLRGSLAILDAMALGYRALKFSTDVQLDPRYQPKAEGQEAAVAEPAAAAADSRTTEPESGDEGNGGPEAPTS